MFADQVKRKKHLTINRTPLIDVLFLLLIFFMVSSTFRENPAINVTLPKAKTAELTKTEETVVTIDKEGKLYLNADEIVPEELHRGLTGVFMQKGETNLVLQADENVPYKIVIFVMDIARDIGFNSIVALTTKSDE